MDLEGNLSVLLLVVFLEPVEEPLLRRLKLEQIHSFRGLLDLLKLAIAREHIQTLNIRSDYYDDKYVNRVFGVCVAPLELLHALGILSHPDYSLSALRLDHTPIVVHLAGLDLNQSLGLNAVLSGECLPRRVRDHRGLPNSLRDCSFSLKVINQLILGH